MCIYFCAHVYIPPWKHMYVYIWQSVPRTWRIAMRHAARAPTTSGATSARACRSSRATGSSAQTGFPPRLHCLLSHHPPRRRRVHHRLHLRHPACGRQCNSTAGQEQRIGLSTRRKQRVSSQRVETHRCWADTGSSGATPGSRRLFVTCRHTPTFASSSHSGKVMPVGFERKHEWHPRDTRPNPRGSNSHGFD